MEKEGEKPEQPHASPPPQLIGRIVENTDLLESTTEEESSASQDPPSTGIVFPAIFPVEPASPPQELLRLEMTVPDALMHLVRAVPLCVLLDRFGTHFQEPPSLNSDPVETMRIADLNFAMSKESAVIDDFISHPWQAPGEHKYRALCLLYNTGFAATVSFVFLVAVAGAQLAAILPSIGLANDRCIWCSILVPPVFLLGLITAHQIPASLGGSPHRRIFLDKLCVHQGNVELQEQATLALAAIVARSERMILLWTPEFFDRLWCALEVAAICYTHDQRTLQGTKAGSCPILFVPLFMCEVSCGGFAVSWVYLIVWNFIPPGPVYLAGWFIWALFLFSIARRFVACHDVMTNEVRNFTVAKSKCSEESDIPVIVNTIEHWFGSVQKFEDFVKTRVLHHVEASRRDIPRLPARWLFVLYLPIFFAGVDGFVNRPEIGMVFVLFDSILMGVLLVRWYILVARATYGLGQWCRSCRYAFDCLGALFATTVGFFMISVMMSAATAGLMVALMSSALLVSLAMLSLISHRFLSLVQA